jgi:MarR family transcriptional regulator, lower aerobic nicotinate degradation pathway regulator
MAKPKSSKANHAEVSRAINALRRMVRGLRAAAEEVERDLKISAAQLFVMRELETSPAQSVKDLAELTMTTHSTVSEVVSQLLAKGLVTRTTDPTDARRSVLRLTRQGASLLRRSPRAIQQDLIEGFTSLRPAERRGLTTGLEKWIETSGLGSTRSSMLFEKPPLKRRGSRRK